jgi:hydrogenase expression/formation protein HypC
MCLSVPGQVVDVGEEHGLSVGRVRFGGIMRQVCLEHVPDAAPGDWVLVHVGFALAKIDEAEAQRVFSLLEELGALEELEEPAP